MKKVKITFEDQGQDFLWWEVTDGVVTDCGPFQAWAWVGSRILNPEGLKVGDCVEYQKHNFNFTIKYPVVDIQRLEVN